jgi:hypothetical protein
MTRDEVLLLSLVAAFATFVTAHVALVVGLASRPPRWRALLALPFVPLAPYWGARAGMHVRVVLWGASATAYTVFRVLSSR